MTLAAQVAEGSVSKMLTGKGVVSAAKTVNLSFQKATAIESIAVTVGQKVKKGQKIAQEGNGGQLRDLFRAQHSLTQQQAALDLILQDVNPRGLERIWERAKRVADQAHKNIELRENADRWLARRSEHAVDVDRKEVDKAAEAYHQCQDAVVIPPVTQDCSSQKAAVDTAKLKLYNDRTAEVSNYKNLAVNRGVLISTYRAARRDAVAAYNIFNIARANRPNQIVAARAQVASALVNVANAQGSLSDTYIYAPLDGTVSAIAGTAGEYNAGGNNLTANTPVAPGGTAKIPTVGELAGADQKNLTGGQTPNLGLQAVLPGGNAFMQLTDVSAFSVVAAFAQNDAAQLHAGDSAKMTLDAMAGKVIDGTVASVAPSPAPGVNGAPMYYASMLLNKDQVPDGLLPGQTGNVSVVTSTIVNKAMVVPTSAVIEDDGQSFVTVPGPNNTQVTKPFTRGKVGDDNTQVLDGLKAGDTVLIPRDGRLPTPATDTAPPVPRESVLNIDRVDPPARSQSESPAAASEPVPMMPALASDTYPGDPGDVTDAGSAGAPAGSPTAGMGGVNPFAPTPSSSGN